ncbi:MAG: UbiA family prenyltransferase [Planctomycetes bacterium]|nr:UbiA family prenyltransferase [Planctomycetota bacterium]
MIEEYGENDELEKTTNSKSGSDDNSKIKQSDSIEAEIEKRYDTVYDSDASELFQENDKTDKITTKKMPPAKSVKGFFVGLMMLLGIPLVFGVIAEVIAGVIISQQIKNSDGVSELEIINMLPLLKIGYVLIICTLLFMAGYIFNDIFDLRKDRKIHKHKPLVNKSVPLWLAWILGISFMLGAGSLAYYQASEGTFLIVLALIIAIFIYAILAKQEKIMSAVVIGIYNIIFIYLGASAVIEIPMDIINFDRFVEKEILWFYPAAIGIYMIGVTLVSTLEDMKPAPFRLTVSNLFILIGLVVPPGFKYVQVHLQEELVHTMWKFSFITSSALAGGLILVLVIVMSIALYENTAKNLHRIFTVGRLGLIWLCAAIIASLGMPVTSLVVALLSVPAIMLFQQLPDPAKRRIVRHSE